MKKSENATFKLESSVLECTQVAHSSALHFQVRWIKRSSEVEPGWAPVYAASIVEDCVTLTSHPVWIRRQMNRLRSVASVILRGPQEPASEDRLDKWTLNNQSWGDSWLAIEDQLPWRRRPRPGHVSIDALPTITISDSYTWRPAGHLAPHTPQVAVGRPKTVGRL